MECVCSLILLVKYDNNRVSPIYDFLILAEN